MIDDWTEQERQHENAWLRAFGQGTIEEAEARGKSEGRAEGRAEGKSEGRAEGKAEGEALGELRAMIRFRGLLCTEEQEARICAEQDLQTLRRRAARAPSAPSVEAILRDEAS